MAEIDFKLLQEMIDCVKREVKIRYAVYPGRVKAGKITADKARKEQALMYATQKALQKIYDGTAPAPVQQSFFECAGLYKRKLARVSL